MMSMWLQEGQAPMDLSLVQRRLKEVVHVLDNFGKLRAEGRSRKQYIEQVGRALSLALHVAPHSLEASLR